MAGSLRPLMNDDLPQVERIQREAYPNYHKESLAVFADKLARYPTGCWAFLADGGEMVGYLFSHPGLLDDPPRLDELLPPPSVGPEAIEPDCYFIHDKSVLPTHRGLGAGKLLMAAALRHAAERGFTTLALVAVQNARPYWERIGFALVADGPGIEIVRKSYGPDARYMVKRQ
jgi:ribosomal protein S18 acetylase RimI-like enzyme